MSLPQGTIGCVSLNIINAWYNPQQPPIDANKYTNILFREAVYKASLAGHHYIYFQPDGATAKDYNAPCPVGWVRGQTTTPSCNAPESYDPPSGCGTNIQVNVPNKRTLESQCELQYPIYAKGNGWSSATLPQMIGFNMVFPNSANNQCPSENPVYVYALPTGQGVLQGCLDDRTDFNNCFVDSGIQYLTQNQSVMIQQSQQMKNKAMQQNLQIMALQSGKTPQQIQEEVAQQAEQTSNQQALSAAQDEKDSLTREQTALNQNLEILYGARYDQKQLADLIQKQRLTNQYSLQQSSQDIYLQNQRWKISKRIQEIQNEWFDRFIFLVKIMIVILVIGLTMYYYYVRGGNMNFGDLTSFKNF